MTIGPADQQQIDVEYLAVRNFSLNLHKPGELKILEARKRLLDNLHPFLQINLQRVIN